METQETSNLTDSTCSSTDSGTEVDISAQDLHSDDGEFGFKITNICTLAPQPQEEIDGFEMECENIEEERLSDVQSDEETEAVADKIIIPRTTATSINAAVDSNTIGKKTIIYCSPKTVTKATPTSTAETMCTVINSGGVTSLLPQSVIEANMALSGSPTVLQGPATATPKGGMLVNQPSQIIQSNKPVTGIKLIRTNPQTKEQKVIFIPASTQVTQPAPSPSVITVRPPTSSCVIGQPASVVPQVTSVPLAQGATTVNTSVSAANLMSLITSKVISQTSNTVPLNSNIKVIKVMPAAPIQTPATPVKTVGMVAAPNTGQPMFTTLPVSSLTPPVTQQTATQIQPVQTIINGQIQLAIPVQQPAAQVVGNQVQQILFVANPVKTQVTPQVTNNPVTITSPRTPVQFVTAPTITSAKTQASTIVVANPVPSTQTVLRNVNGNTLEKNKFIPVIFAPPEAAKTATVKKQPTLPVNPAFSKLNIDFKTGKVVVLNPAAKKAITPPKRSAMVQTPIVQVKKPKIANPIATPKQPKIMVSKETNTDINDEAPERDPQQILEDLEAKRRKVKRLKRKLTKKKKEEQEEVNFNIWQDPGTVRRSSRIRSKPQKSYAEKDSDDSFGEDEEEELEKEVEGQGYEAFLAQLELEIKTASQDLPEKSTEPGEKPTEDIQPGETAGETVTQSGEETATKTSDEAMETKGSSEGKPGRPSKRESLKKPFKDDPDFVLSGEESDSDYKIEDEEEEDENEEEDELDLPKWKRPNYKFPKPRPPPRPKPFPDVNLDDHKEKYVVEDKPTEEDPDRKMFTCKVCEFFNCISQVAMSTHISKHLSGKFNCKFCSYNDVTSSLVQHIATAHPEKSKFKCTKCDKGFMTRSDYRTHMSKEHEEYIFSCEFCGKGFTYTRHLRKHLYKFHDGDGIFECKNCGKCFILEYFYQRHLKAKACQKVSCLCQECGAILANSTQLSEHRRRIHQRERNYMCNICNFTCYRLNQLKDHINTHTGDYPHKCKLCDFRAAKGYQVTSHMRTHTGKTPFKCDQCNYQSRWNIQLRTHRPAHKSPHMVMCEPCGIAYKDERGLKLHQKKRHSKNSAASVDGDNADGDSLDDKTSKASDNEEEDDGADNIANEDEGADEHLSDSVSNPASVSVDNQDESSSCSSKASLDNSSECSAEVKDTDTEPDHQVSEDVLEADQLKTAPSVSETKESESDKQKNKDSLPKIPNITIKIV